MDDAASKDADTQASAAAKLAEQKAADEKAAAELASKGKMKAIYLDKIKAASCLMKEAHGHAETGLVPKAMCKSAIEHIDEVIKSVEKVDEVGKDAPATVKDKDIQLPADLTGTLQLSYRQAFDAQFGDLAECERLLGLLSGRVAKEKAQRASATLSRLFGVK